MSIYLRKCYSPSTSWEVRSQSGLPPALLRPLWKEASFHRQYIKKVDTGVSESLRDCFERTGSILLGTQEEGSVCVIDSMVYCITDYMNFCRDTVIPVRTVHCFPNKSWITNSIKALLNKK